MRLFIAIEIDEILKEKIHEIQKSFVETGSDVKWVERKNLHFTLKFLGETQENKLKDVEDAVKKSLVDINAFQILIEKTGTFPAGGQPRVIWMGISEGAERLEKISGRLNENLCILGFEKEKRGFTPHLTIGRARSNRGMMKLKEKIIQYKDVVIGAAQVSEVLLMQSKLTPSGPIYSKEGIFKL